MTRFTTPSIAAASHASRSTSMARSSARGCAWTVPRAATTRANRRTQPLAPDQRPDRSPGRDPQLVGSRPVYLWVIARPNVLAAVRGQASQSSTAIRPQSRWSRRSGGTSFSAGASSGYPGCATDASLECPRRPSQAVPLIDRPRPQWLLLSRRRVASFDASRSGSAVMPRVDPTACRKHLTHGASSAQVDRGLDRAHRR
jgi:hypothetical protein